MATKREKQLATTILKERIERLTGKKVVFKEELTREAIAGLQNVNQEDLETIRNSYYNLSDNLPSLVSSLNVATGQDVAWQEEYRIFSEIQALLDQSKIGELL